MINISPVLEKLECMKLTEFGKLSLSCFSDEVLRWADKQTLSSKSVEDVYVYFAKCCEYYSNAFKILIDNDFKDQALAAYRGPRDILYTKKDKVTSQMKESASNLPWVMPDKETIEHEVTSQLPTLKQYESEKNNSYAGPSDDRRFTSSEQNRKCSDRLRDCQIRTWTKLRDNGTITHDHYERLISAIDRPRY